MFINYECHCIEQYQVYQSPFDSLPVSVKIIPDDKIKFKFLMKLGKSASEMFYLLTGVYGCHVTTTCLRATQTVPWGS